MERDSRANITVIDAGSTSREKSWTLCKSESTCNVASGCLVRESLLKANRIDIGRVYSPRLNIWVYFAFDERCSREERIVRDLSDYIS